MGRARVLFAAALTVPTCLLSCVGTTGGALVEFRAAAAGPADADPSHPFVFQTGRWQVTLDKAVLHLGAVYLLQSRPTSGSQPTTCILPDVPGAYVAQVAPSPAEPASGLDVDLLSPTPQRFSATGQGTTEPPALLGQVWLTGGAVDSTDDTTPILIVAGTADDRNGTTIPFAGTITIGTNRESTASPDASVPIASQAAGSDPICKQRIVSIPTDVAVQPTGGLLVRIDPRILFVAVHFEELTKPAGSETYAFVDAPNSGQPSTQLWNNLHSAGSVFPLYAFSWSDSL